jgi:hypothetical protein
MLIRVHVDLDGIEEYLENGQKQRREFEALALHGTGVSDIPCPDRQAVARP